MPTEYGEIHLCDVDTTASGEWMCDFCGITWSFSETAQAWKPVAFPTIEMM